MSVEAVQPEIEQARSALARYAWREAYDLLSAADPGQLTASDVEGLQKAAWWLGRLDESIAAGERAYAAYLKTGMPARAAIVAMALGKDNYGKRASSVGTAWLTRAEKLLADLPEQVEHGYGERLRAVVAFEGEHDYERALEHAERALEIGMRYGDRDLQAMAVHDKGRVLVELGRVAEGQALMDEANVAAVSGELQPMTTGIIYCNTIGSCESIADYRRASEWTEAAKRWCDRQAISGFPGLCRVHRAGIIRRRGLWTEAEAEARRAWEELSSFYTGYGAEAFYEIGETRRLVGDLAGAEEAFTQAHELGRDPQPGIALVRLAQGRQEAAASCVRRALEEDVPDLPRARILPAAVEIAVAGGDVEWARACADELERIAGAYGSDALQAFAAEARGRVRLAEGDAQAAARAFRRAQHLWQELEAPYESAVVRALIGEAYRACGAVEDALLELRAARATFERLGAAPDARRVAALLEPQTAATVSRAFLFTDIVRSTALVEAMGDEAWESLLRWHDATLRALFAEHGGEEVKQVGDGFFVAFADAEAALACAIAIQRRLAEHRRDHGFAPQVRIGVHAAEATQRERDYAGRGVHLAARIGEVAQPGEILASAVTLTAARRGRAGETRRVEVKGVAEPVEVVAVDWR